MTRVLLDANALMMPVEVGVRVFDELDRLFGSRSADEPRRPSAAGPARGVGFGPAENTGDTEGTETIDTAVGSVVDGVTLLVPVAVIDELDRLSSGRGKEGTAASVGADLGRDRCTILSHDAAYADDAICELATDPREVIDYVLTNDRDLQERLGAHDVPVICLRGHNQLAIQKS